MSPPPRCLPTIVQSTVADSLTGTQDDRESAHPCLLWAQGTSKTGQDTVAHCIAVLCTSAGPKQITTTVTALLKTLQV